MNQITVIDAESSTMLVEIEPEGMPVVLVEVATAGAMGPPGSGGGGGEGGSSDWADITNKPATFPPTLPIAQSGVTNLVTDQATQNTAIAGKAPTVHTHAQSDVTSLVSDLATKAPLANPALTGVPTAPTAAPATNTTQLATTAFVTVAVSGATGGTITEAPTDGKSYARKSLGWDDLTDDFAAKAPVSHTHTTAQITGLDTALTARELTASKGAVNGYAGLDASGKIPSIQLPSYVDDVQEFANLAAFPGTGTAGIIYVDLATNRVYRWGGSSYIEISSSPGSSDQVAEGSVNLYYTTARAALKLDVATYTAADVLTKIKTVDGAASGLDADLLDAQDSVYYLGRANHTGTQLASTISDFSTAADARVAVKITNKITVASTAPSSPATNDVWIDTT